MIPATTTADRRFDIEGHDLGYPTFFRDGSSMMGLFLVPTAAASTLIAPSGFTAAEIAPGRSVMSMVCVHYTDTDCGSYEEIAFAIFVNPHDSARRIPYASTAWRAIRGSVATYTWRLGVTTELSRRAGLEMWGFPKTLEDLRFAREGGRAAMTWMDGETEVLRYELPAAGTRTPRRISPPVYSLLGGAPQVGHLTQSYSGVGHHRGSASLRLGDHPVADELRTLGLPRAPLVGVWSEHLDFEMSAPRPV